MAVDTQPFFVYVEDDLSSRQVLEIILTRIMGYSNVRFYEDGVDLVSKLKNFPAAPDVIFLDLLLRPVDGYTILKELRSDPFFQATKVVAITSSVMASDVSRMQQSGFHGLIGKPLIHKIFPNLLQKILAGEPVWYIS